MSLLTLMILAPVAMIALVIFWIVVRLDMFGLQVGMWMDQVDAAERGAKIFKEDWETIKRWRGK